MTQIYGYAFHSPLILRQLVPLRDHVPIYLESRWVASDLYKNVNPMLNADTDKIIVLLAGSLTILHSFLKTFPDILEKRKIKVILFDFPGLVNPFKDPLIQWIDCDHQVGGAWQITKTKLSNFELLIKNQKILTDEGKDLILRMTRFISRDRISEIEKFQEYMPTTYKDLIDYDMSDDDSADNKGNNYDTAKDMSWKKKTFVDLLKDFFIYVPIQKRRELYNLLLDYQLNKISKRDYNIKLKSYIENNSSLKKAAILIRKWMDDSKKGRSVYKAYLDYIANITRRSWKTILEDHKVCNELDLIILIEKQNRDIPDIAISYSEDLKDIVSLPSNMHTPEKTIRWSDGSLYYHPEPPNVGELFELDSNEGDE